MSERPVLCMVSDAIGPWNAIGKVALAEVEVALGAGWRVICVAQRLDESLREEWGERVQWRKLYVPPRGFLVQWLSGRHWIKRALRGLRYDVLHVHQPQAADLADVFQCHFLTRVAYERRCLERRKTLRARIVRAQQQGVLYAEDYFFRRWNPRTRMLFGGEMMRREFARLYGPPPRQRVLPLPVPPYDPPSDEERAEARRALVGGLVGEHEGPVVGYLGGVQERKGYDRLIRGLEGERDVFLLMGGPYSEGFRAPELGGRMRAVGLTDAHRFYAACDVFAVPSRFEPTGLVALEAAARGVPVLATEEVGALPELLRFGAGEQWDPDEPLGPLVQAMVENRETYRAGAERMAAELSAERMSRGLLAIYEDVLRERQHTSASMTAA